MASRKALYSLLSRLGADEADEALIDYLCSVIDDANDAEDSEAVMEQARELLVEMAPRFGAWSLAQQTVAVIDLFETAQSDSCEGSSQSTDINTSSDQAHTPRQEAITAQTLVEQLRQLQVQALTTESATSRCRIARADSSSSSRAAAAAVPGPRTSNEADAHADPAALSALRELCSGSISDKFLAFVLVKRCCNDMESAATWLIEQDAGAAEAHWRLEREEELQVAQESERARQKSKAALLARFDLQAVPQPTEGKKERHVEAWTAGKQQKQPPGKVRYRDGVVVSCSGEKYIVQKTTPDYDGGSRGKVYTKGKRGKGFV